MDETYIKFEEVWKYRYRAVDNQGETVDFLLTAKRDIAAAKCFFGQGYASEWRYREGRDGQERRQ